MQKLTRKGVLLFAGATAVCAFVLPSAASAASWGPVGSHHTLDSPNFGFTSVILGAGATSQCTSSSFTADVVSSANLSITTGTLGGLCTASGAAIGTCKLTVHPTFYPWTLTLTATFPFSITLDGIVISIRFDNPPGLNSCANVNGADMTLTGRLTGGNWTGNASHSMDFNNSEGLVSHSALGNNTPITTRALLTDTSGTLTAS
jgi:hypothetical protein